MLDFIFIVRNAGAVLFSKRTKGAEFLCSIGDRLQSSPNENALEIIRSDTRNNLALSDDRKAGFVCSLKAFVLVSSRRSVEIDNSVRVNVT